MKNFKNTYVKLYPFPSYQLLTHVSQLYLLLYSLPPVILLFLPLQLNFYIWYEIETYTSLSPWQKIVIEDVINLITSSYDPCKSDRPYRNFANVNKIWKMKTSVNFFYQGDLIVKVLWEYKLLISRYSLVIIFPRNSGLQIVTVLKYEHLARSCL